MGEVKTCGLCASSNLAPILDMGSQPLAERYGDSTRYPLALLECGDCTLVQLSYVVPQAQVFPLGHPYTSGSTQALRDHFADLAAQVSGPLRGGDLVVDIGANDGTLLAAFGEEFRRVGVEPTNQAAKCRERGIPVVQEFFTPATAGKIRGTWGMAKAITACNVLAHVPDPHGFVEGAAGLLAPDGVFVTENHDVAAITGGLQVDTVYHEHLRYYSIATLGRLLAAHGLQVDATERIDTHGGSVRVWARKPHGAVQGRADAAARALRAALGGITDAGHVIYGIGATTRATPLIHYARIAEHITCVCEVAGSEKTGQTIPGTTIPIVDEERLFTDQPGYALLFAHHLAGTLVPKLRARGYAGKFITPLPGFRVLDG